MSSEINVIYGGEAQEVFSEFCKNYSSVAVVSGQKTASIWMDKFSADLGVEVKKIVFDCSEENKNLKTIEKILSELKTAGLDRKSLIISLGGGVANDIVGFAASIYMRGVDWVSVPTTVLAQADASIGGKTGVNLNTYKNMVGSFYQPKFVWINPEFLTTLDEIYVREGIGEIIKMGFIYDKKILELLDSVSGDLLNEKLHQAIKFAGEAKVEIVKKDSFEKAERKLVNFGHTVGHAVESLSLEQGQTLLHGQAVGIGVIAETKLAELEGVCAVGLGDKVKQYVSEFGLPIKTSFPLDNILEKITSDKKNIGDKILWALPTEEGKGIFDHQASQQNIEEAIKSILS